MIDPGPLVTMTSSVVPVIDAATGGPAVTPTNNCPSFNTRSWTVFVASIYGTEFGFKFGNIKL